MISDLKVIDRPSLHYSKIALFVSTTIAQIPPPLNCLPRRGGNLKNLKKGWKYGAGAGLLKRREGGAGTFPI